MTQEELLKLIDQAAEEGWTELDLAGQDLTELPEQIGKLTKLETLILGKWHREEDGYLGNSLSKLPHEIGNLKNLKNLYASGNKLLSLPEEVGNLKGLKNLYVDSNQLTSLPDSIGELINLENIYIDSNSISTLPISFENLKSLRSLHFSDNKLEFLPKAICKLEKIEFINLSFNHLSSLPAEINKLDSLIEIHIDINRISTFPREIIHLRSLKSLDISSNQISSLPEYIVHLGQLEELNLDSNHISELPKFIGNLSKLENLSISNNELPKIPDCIALLENLRILKVNDNDIVAISKEIKKLNKLESLQIYKNRLSFLPIEISSLHRLKDLNVAENCLQKLPKEVGEIEDLESLNASRNQISILPEEIGNLINLKRLDLSWNVLREIPRSIGKLEDLEVLELNHNQISSFPIEGENLKRINLINLTSNDISHFPEEIIKLSSLTYLLLGSNCLKSLPEKIKELKDLHFLGLNQNLFFEFPEEIFCLSNLFYLNLNLKKNEIKTLPPNLIELENLQYLDVQDNQISTLPECLTQLKTLEELDLRGNPVPIPPEILGANDKYDIPGDLQAILDYYFQTQDPSETEPLYEAKFIIVGEGGAGKTTLAKKLLNSNYELDTDEDSTEGIDVLRWELNQPDDTSFRINIWDFGGQEIYHATHQFFLTKRSLYVLVIDTRQDNTDLYYWLNIIELFSDNSPVFIIKNEKQDRQCEVNERQLRGEFTNLEKVFSVNLASNRGLAAVKTAIQQRIVQLDHVGTPLPKVWVRVRAALENYAQSCNTIPLEKYCELCRISQLTDKQRMLNLSQYLHDLGVILHFHDDPILKNHVILKPEWGTAAVYKALDAATVRDNLGRFSRSQLDQIWSDGEYADMRDELLQLMMRFKLCYLIPGSDDQYIAPQLLDIDKPDYPWDTTSNLVLRYHYEFMPKGILTRFIVEMHKFIEAQTLVWKSGVVLTNGTARAEVVEFYHKGEIHIRVSGTRPKDLLTVITHEIDKINESYDRIRVDKFIPCNCDTCQTSDPPQFFPLAVLNRFIDQRQDTIQCQTSFAMVAVRQLILGVSNPLYSPDIRKLDDRPVESSPLYLEHRTASWPTQTLQTPTPSPNITPTQRLQILKTLRGLPRPQFEDLLFALHPPAGNVADGSAPQSNRVTQLLTWAESDIGCGLATLQETLKMVISD